ncbi:MAG: AAA family ATPase [Eubacteriales bacterium]
MEKNKIVAVMGSPSSGKTVTTIKLAMALASHKKSVVIVALDRQCPVIPYVLSSKEEQPLSLGEFFSEEKHADPLPTLTVPNHTFLEIIGYGLEDCQGNVTEDDVCQLLTKAQSQADYVLVDCSSNFEEVATITAVELADVVIQVGSADTKGLSYYANVDKLLDVGKRGVFVMGNLRKGQDFPSISKSYGGVRHCFPFCLEIHRQWLETKLFHPLEEKNSQKYQKVMAKLVADVFGLYPEIKSTQQKPSLAHRLALRVLQGKGKGEF